MPARIGKARIAVQVLKDYLVEIECPRPKNFLQFAFDRREEPGTLGFICRKVVAEAPLQMLWEWMTPEQRARVVNMRVLTTRRLRTPPHIVAIRDCAGPLAGREQINRRERIERTEKCKELYLQILQVQAGPTLLRSP